MQPVYERYNHLVQVNDQKPEAAAMLCVAEQLQELNKLLRQMAQDVYGVRNRAYDQ